jgi:hypothetical protein
MFIRLCSIFFSSHLIYGFLNNKTTPLRVSHIKKYYINAFPFMDYIQNIKKNITSMILKYLKNEIFKVFYF